MHVFISICYWYCNLHATSSKLFPVSFIQICRDIDGLLICHEVDDLTVTVWEHSSFINFIKTRYLHDPAEVKFVHSMLADYYLGTWASKLKPIKLRNSDETCGTKILLPCGNVADRIISHQPMKFVTDCFEVNFLIFTSLWCCQIVFCTFLFDAYT